ncbi:MAG: thioesterase family protein [Planctomycetota bacterium]|jgi:acyl-CoA thioester hydrolase|nr:thioesterase family protein [Planctomycetota bacterium]
MAHTHQIRVRYAETDAQQVAHHSAYVVWLEEARIEALRTLGRSYRQLEADGTLLPVIAVNVRYRQALRFDDVADLVTEVSVDSPSRISFATAVCHGETLCAEATVTVAAVGADGRPKRLPADLVALLD